MSKRQGVRPNTTRRIRIADIIDDQGSSTHKEKERWGALVLTSKPDQMLSARRTCSSEYLSPGPTAGAFHSRGARWVSSPAFFLAPNALPPKDKNPRTKAASSKPRASCTDHGIGGVCSGSSTLALRSLFIIFSQDTAFGRDFIRI